MNTDINEDKQSFIEIGWFVADITPEYPVQLAGQFHARVSEGVMDPVTATVLAISSKKTDQSYVVMVSCDLASISDSLRNAVRHKVSSILPEINPLYVVLNATHTHTAPEVRVAEDYALLGGGMSSMGMCVDLPAMNPADYISFAADIIADAVISAWRNRKPGKICYGLGQALVGRNRRSVFDGGISCMYGDTSTDNFSHIEGYEDHEVNLLATLDLDGVVTGIVVNVACPAQVSENDFLISADYWHETRQELRSRLGDKLYIMPQCSAAGDQSPHIQWNNKANERMLRLSGLSHRQQIAQRIADAVTTILPVIVKEPQDNPEIYHKVEIVDLTRRKLSANDVSEALDDAENMRAEYELLQREIESTPDYKENPRWYVQITRAYRRMMWCQAVANRFENEKINPVLPIEVHLLRLGDVLLAFNPFEYYLDFGIQIKARSKAIQTFIIQLAGSGTYVPTEKAVSGKSYGAIPASTPIGPVGGKELVEWTVAAINEIWK